MNKLLIICGATATGKTKLAIDCAKKLKSEVISADSELIYKGLDIGTAKPTYTEREGVKHHLIDVIEPTKSFSVSEYGNMAQPIIDRLFSENKTPIVCGGTGFYIDSLIFQRSYGLACANESIRKKYNDILNEKGKEYLYGILCETDGETAKKLHPNDVKRVIRALEIYEVSGIKKSDFCDGLKLKRNYIAVAINFARDELYKRISKRVDDMFEKGLVQEVKALQAVGIKENYQCMQAIGYKEVLKCLQNGDNESTMREIIKRNTRHYAKRQITYFKKIPNLVWLEPQEATAEKVLELLNGKG